MLRLIYSFIGTSVVSLLLLACESDFSRRDESPSYLEETRPACTRIHGSSIDPCERREGWIVRLYPPTYLSGYIRTPDLPIDIEWRYRGMWQRGGTAGGLMTPQIVIRGTALPNTTRCVEYTDYVFGGQDDGPGYSDSDFVGEVCFVDISVGEYIVGIGPETLPVVVGWRYRVPTTVEGYGTVGYYARLVEPIEEMMGGYEFVIALARPLNMAWAEWGLGDVWDVQRRTDGAIVGQHELYSFTGHFDNKSDYEYPLADLQQKIRDTHAKLSVEFGGRVGEDTDSPKLVSDANRRFLLEQLRELGAYDVPNITPKPAPERGR